jgi:hypothetical protein
MDDGWCGECQTTHFDDDLDGKCPHGVIRELRDRVAELEACLQAIRTIADPLPPRDFRPAAFETVTRIVDAGLAAKEE